MDLTGFILGFTIATAQNVVAEFIAMGASGWWSRRQISKPTMQRMVVQAIQRDLVQQRHVALSDHEIDELVGKVLEEIRCLAQAHPDLEWRPLRPLRTLPPVPRYTPTRQYQDILLEERLARLNSIVAMRRRQVGLPSYDQAVDDPPLRSLPARPAAFGLSARPSEGRWFGSTPVPLDDEDWEARLRDAKETAARRRSDGPARRRD